MSIATYKDLCCEIEILQERIRDLEQELRDLRRQMFANAPTMSSATNYTQGKVTNSRHVPTLNEVVLQMNEIYSKLGPLHENLNARIRTKKNMENTLNQFGGLEYKVIRLRMQGLTLGEIAGGLGYSYDSRTKEGTKKAPTY